MTGQLLRVSHPALARRIHHVLSLQRMQDNNNPMLLTYSSLTQALDAMIVTQVIAALTEVGRDWLSHPEDHPVSFEPLKGLLHQWIDLGDWILCHSDAKP